MKQGRIMNYFVTYFVGLIWINCCIGVNGIPCNAGDYIGYADTVPTGTTAGPNVASSYLLLGTNMKVPCCGVITRWKFGALNSGDLTAQVWKHVSGDSYELVGENAATGVTANSEAVIDVAAADYISVEPDYAIGWSTPLNDIVSFLPDGGANMAAVTNPGKSNVGATDTWSTASGNDTQRWLVRVEFGPGSPPDFGASLPHTTTAAVTDAPGTIVHTLTPTDVNTAETLTVSIISGDSNFQLDADNNVQISSTLSPGNYTVVFEVVDSCGLSYTDTLTVMVAETPPVIESLPVSGFTVREDIPAVLTELHTLIVSDDDTDLIDITCRVTSTDPTPAPFKLSVKAGTSDYVVYYVPKTSDKLDYDVKPLYSIYMVCNDGTSDSIEKEFQITIVPNDAPVPDIPTPLQVDAETTGRNTYVGSVTATDTENDQLTYTFENGNNCPFRMNKFGQIYSTQDLNDYREPLCTANVTVSDQYNVVGPTEMEFEILNINTPPEIYFPSKDLPFFDVASVDEHTDEGTPNPKGTVVDVFTATGFDAEGDPITWEMDFHTGQGIELYEYDPDSGIITTKNDIDFETISEQGLEVTKARIRAFDGREYSEWRELEITLNDINETPAFASTLYTIETDESAVNELDCPFLEVIDEDLYDTTAITGNCDGTGIFQVDRQSTFCGIIQKQAAEWDLDNPGAELAVVRCELTVADKGLLTNTTVLEIIIHEEDDIAPDFEPSSYVYTIPDTTPPGTIIGDVDATDDDYLEEHRKITYSTKNNNFGVFDNGRIFLKTDYTKENVPTTETFTVEARDEAGHVDYATVTVHIEETPTTTTTTTVTTTLAETYQAYDSFMSNPANLAWLIPAILLGLAALGLSIFMCVRCCTAGACSNMCTGGNIFGRSGRSFLGRGRRVNRVKEPVRKVKRTLVREKQPKTVRVVEKKQPVRVVEREQPIRVIEREPERIIQREPVHIVEKEPPTEVINEKPVQEPKKSKFSDFFKSKPKVSDKPPTEHEPWDFWNTGHM